MNRINFADVPAASYHIMKIGPFAPGELVSLIRIGPAVTTTNNVLTVAVVASDEPTLVGNAPGLSEFLGCRPLVKSTFLFNGIPVVRLSSAPDSFWELPLQLKMVDKRYLLVLLTQGDTFDWSASVGVFSDGVDEV